MNITISEVGTEEKNSVYEFFKRWFFSSEPITMSWADIPPKDAVSFIRAIDHGLSIKAVDEEGNVAAVCINGDDRKLFEDAPPTIPDDLQKLYDFFDLVISQCDPAVDFMSVLVVSVAGYYRRLGLCQRLLNATLDVASKKGYRGARILCTSSHTAAAAEGAGWECVLSKLYQEYLDPINGTPLYSPSPPHLHVSVYQKTVQD